MTNHRISHSLLACAALALLLTSACTFELLPVPAPPSLEEAQIDAPAPAADTQRQGDVDNPLSESTWVLSAYGEASTMQSAIDAIEVTAQFASDGSLTGSAGCNRYTTTYEVSGEQLILGPIGTTRMLCRDNMVQQQETLFLTTLESMASRATFEILDGELRLFAGENMLVFKGN